MILQTGDFEESWGEESWVSPNDVGMNVGMSAESFVVVGRELSVPTSMESQRYQDSGKTRKVISGVQEMQSERRRAIETLGCKVPRFVEAHASYPAVTDTGS